MLTTDQSAYESVSVSKDGKSLAAIRRSRTANLWAAGEPSRLVDDASTAAPASFSPDGRWILYFSFRKVGEFFRDMSFILPASGGSSVATRPAPPGAGSIQWGPDDRSLAFVRAVDGVENLYRQPIAGGDPVPITRFKEGRVAGYDWSDDGSRLWLHRSVGSVPSVWVTPPGGGEPAPITDFKTGVFFGEAWSAATHEVVFTYGEAIEDVVLIRDFR